MNLNIEEHTIVEWYADREQHKCGYCKNERGSCSYGMWAESMTVDDYQDLIDRGWRRSGKYCYKPTMTETCCPQYTIRCQALNLQLSKSQKKVLKKFNRFLSDGNLGSQSCSNDSIGNDDDGVNDIFIREGQHVIIDKNLITNREGQFDEECICDVDYTNTTQQQISNGLKPATNDDTTKAQANTKTKKSAFKEGKGIDPNKPPCKKAKQLRLEKKKEKLLKRGMSLEKLNAENDQKSLEQFIEDVGNAKHKLTLKLVPTSRPGVEWDSVKHAELQLYAKYQSRVHNDPPDKVTMRSFERFLVSSPLQIKLERVDDKSPSFRVSAKLFEKYQVMVHNEPVSECDEIQYRAFLVDSPLKPVKFANGVAGPGYGSFHQQYWIDDKLIAVGVIDVLPRCVSSVYFFYDPDYRILTLGTYGSLREIHFTRSLNGLIPAIDHYYMGFYIHSCPKMLYKGKLKPSFLLCPETYKWFPIENCIPKLNASKYSRLNEDLEAVDEDDCEMKDLDLIKILLLTKHKLTQFRLYKTRYGEEEVFRNIGKLVGKKVCKNVIFIK